MGRAAQYVVNIWTLELLYSHFTYIYQVSDLYII